MNYKKVQDEAFGHPMVLMPPNTQHMEEHPQIPNIKGIFTISHADIQKHTDAQGSQPMNGGLRHIGKHPHTGGGVQHVMEVSNM